ncbi:ABC transporter permease [Haloarculaceae archaeon H-GB2-1]|nr:ABC transporter permease [Haloarculaceae archaeon H-GB1-1]MEA5408076.1 ABC transporter permease [Haloarculaceae archaeon H-GB2-1]
MNRKAIALVVVAGVALAGLVSVAFFPAGSIAAVVAVVDANYLGAALRLTVPIAFAALGGIFAEKSGVINIGLEGLLIIAAFVGIATTYTVGGGQAAVWIGFAAAVLASTLFALLFAVVTIEFKADQIIAGLAVWLIALGLGPFTARVIWGTVNSPSVPTLNDWTVPVLSEIPWVGPVLFDANPTVYMLLVAVPLSWYALNRTAFGYRVRASGENPRALDTAGVNVSLVRYKSVLISGVFSGIGGAGLALGQVGQFIGSGQTMVGGRGWIGITAYLFGNYNPIATFGASFLFAALDALQIRIQQIPGLDLPGSLVRIVPFVIVIVVLALIGKTRLPSAAGEHYDSDED